jgi:hypothetical protein
VLTGAAAAAAAGVASRRAVFERPAAAAATADEDAAAVRIQAAFRGHKARQQLQLQPGQPAADAAPEVPTNPMTADAHATAAEEAADTEPAPSWGIGSRVSALKAMLLGSSDAGSSSSMPGQRPGLQPRSVQVAPVTSSSATSGATGVYSIWGVEHCQLACVARIRYASLWLSCSSSIPIGCSAA